jgi:hypothetical protein
VTEPAGPPGPGPRAAGPDFSDPGAPSRDHGLPEPGARSPKYGLEEPPPFGSWAALYAAVAGTLAVLIALFALFTRAFE